ncbi:MAG: FAD-dependent monooxygenase [Candidatus Brocadiae bacterium]|nr:FAD-dependent monooxygenase [Candidatus Brocadiia bacterium]
MNILVIGGGPAGLYFSLLAKKKHPDWAVRVVERNAPDATFGWGVVFNDKTQNYLRDTDEPTWRDMTAAYQTWDNVDVVHRDTRISIRGNRFSGIQRLAMLQILQKHCAAAGVVLEFGRELIDPGDWKGYDLVVVADGVNSSTRRTLAAHFQPDIQVRPNKYIWYGTRTLFHGLTLTFRPNEHGLWIAHSYKFNADTSTFIVECDPVTWAAAGMDRKEEPAARAYLEQVFAKDLRGAPLLSNKSAWINFQRIRNAHWTHGNMVLIGDALHTAHFSIGSGTRLALEDAIALFGALETRGSVPAGLAAFEAERRPKADDLQAAAQVSMEWFENAGKDMGLHPMELAWVLMTRSGKIDRENLARRDPAFVAAYEAWKAGGGA